MKDLYSREKELLQKLKEAGKKQEQFTLTLKIGDILIEERIFPSSKYSDKTISETSIHFLINDFIREITKVYSEKEKLFQEEEKKKQMDKLWEENEKKNKL